ncbi:hypothetical protein [Nocardia miyunensis]|uniref:hypothetical protein n=1 Tax=Nocardia miyunensis TaxID=282684 RepID=UPI000A78C508|nr:hypothetical protein [Nocardia miyunensis]
MDAYLFGRFGGEVRSFTLPEEREGVDNWAAHCRASARDTDEFDNLHRMVKGYLDTAAEATAEGKFVSISWMDGSLAHRNPLERMIPVCT